MLVLLFATIAFISSGSDSALALAKITLLLGCVVLPLAMTAFHLWNLVYRRGTTGQSLGQQVVKIVHDAINDIDGIHTASEGEDRHRHVVILPD